MRYRCRIAVQNRQGRIEKIAGRFTVMSEEGYIRETKLAGVVFRAVQRAELREDARAVVRAECYAEKMAPIQKPCRYSATMKQ